MANSIGRLTCKCADSTLWEIGKYTAGDGYISCKSCGVVLPMQVVKSGDRHVLVLEDSAHTGWVMK